MGRRFTGSPGQQKHTSNREASALLGCYLAMPRRRGNARLIDRDTQQLRQVALDIVALDEAANDAGLDADGAAAASAAAARLLSWAQAQLKNTASVEDPAAAGSLDGGSGSRGAALHDGTTHGAAAVSASNIAEQQEQQEQEQPATASSTIIPTAQWPEPQLLPHAGQRRGSAGASHEPAEPSTKTSAALEMPLARSMPCSR